MELLYLISRVFLPSSTKNPIILIHFLDHSSDSETSSPERSKLSLEEELLLDRLKLDKQEIEERLQEMEKVVITLQKENQRLQTMFSSQSSQDSLKSVDDEVQDVHDVR